MIKITSTNTTLTQAISILNEIPAFMALVNDKQLASKTPNGLHVLVEFGKPDYLNELGQASPLSENDIESTNSTVDFYKMFREIGASDSTLKKLWSEANNWEVVFQGKHVTPGATVYLVRVTQSSDVYQLAETVAHEFGAHVRGWLLNICDHHDAWGTFVAGSAPDGTIAKEIMNQLKRHKERKTAPTGKVK